MSSAERVFRVSFSVLAMGAVFILFGRSTAAQTTAPKTAPMVFCGTPDSPVKIEIFSDFQCPHCRAFYLDIVKLLVRDYGTSRSVYIVYHDFPLDMHPLARTASRYALAATHISRDSWLRVVEALYANQDQWSLDGKFDPVLAKALKPEELAKVKTLAADPAVENDLKQELALGNSRKITGTPTYFIMAQTGRQQRVDRILSYAIVKSYIDGFLK